MKNNDYFLYQDGILIDEENYGYFEFNNYYGLNHKNLTDLIDTSSKTKTTIPITFTGAGYYENNFITSKNTIREGVGLYSSNYVICQLFPYKELYELPHRYYGSGYRFENHYIQIQNDRKLLKSLSLLTGEYEWEADLSGRNFLFGGEEKEAKITNIFGVVEGLLYVWMDDERLVEIDIKTGKIKTEAFPLRSLQENGIIQSVLQPQYRESEQSIFFFYQDYLVQHHLPSQTTTLIWHDKHYNIGPCFITNDYIYFIGNYQRWAVFYDHIGVFDRQKKEIVWMQQVIELSKETYNNLREIQATDDKIYVLDTEGTLYIFEKEEIV